MSMAFRFIHAADLHLDSPFRGLTSVPEPVAEALRESTFTALRALTNAAIAKEVNFIVLSGDLYDAADRSLRAQLSLQAEWQRLQQHGIQIFVIHGNHDPLSGSRAQLNWPENVTVFGSERIEARPAYHSNGKLAAYVYGLSYGTRAVTENLALRYRREEGAPFHIALLHANVEGRAAHDPYSPCRLDDLKSAGFDYWALGHIHERQTLNEYPHVIYPGNIQGRNPRETKAKGCYVVEVSEQGKIQLAFEPLDHVRWLDEQLSIEGLASEQAFIDAVQALSERVLAQQEGRHVMLRLTLHGRGSLHGKLMDSTALQEWQQQLRELMLPAVLEDSTPWVWLHSLEAETKAEWNEEMLLLEDSFAGELYRLVRQLGESPDELAVFMKEALAELNQHPKLRRRMADYEQEQSADWFESAVQLVLGMLVEDQEGEAPSEKANGGKQDEDQIAAN